MLRLIVDTWPHLELLYVNDSSITDRGLSSIEKRKRLERIYFLGTKVTDAGLVYLKPVKTIEFVGSSDNNSPEALEQLKESLPLFKKNRAG